MVNSASGVITILTMILSCVKMVISIRLQSLIKSTTTLKIGIICYHIVIITYLTFMFNQLSLEIPQLRVARSIKQISYIIHFLFIVFSYFDIIMFIPLKQFVKGASYE